jgi:uncharacterized membrane protein YeaQ/YmgE (transglycosylase-associated protein family)
MDILSWIIVGFLAGWIASIVMRTDGAQDWVMDIFFGVIGAIVGGFIMNALGQGGVSGINLYSIFVATLGAIVVIYFSRLIRRRTL